jgi:hypothetical protein
MCDAAWGTVPGNVLFDYQRAIRAARRMDAYRTAMAVAHQIRAGRMLSGPTNRNERRPTMGRGPAPATVGAVSSGQTKQQQPIPRQGAAQTIQPRPGIFTAPAGDTP